MSKAVRGSGRRMHAIAYTVVTTAIVLLLALAEWATETFVAEHSRIAGTAIEITIVLVGTLVFRPIHQRVEAAVENAFYWRKHQALAALQKFRHELASFSDLGQLLRRVIEALEHHLEARACAVYLHRDGFRAERSSFDVAAPDLDASDPLVLRLLSSGQPARPAALTSNALGTHAFPLNAAGELIGFIAVDCKHGEYDKEELDALAGLAKDLAAALVALDPLLRAQKSRGETNLPADLPPLIGRERERAELSAALAQSRLVTVTGAGGVGKTRVALECAREAVERREHGAWFIDLAPIRDGTLTGASILSALNAPPAEPGTERSRLIEYLRPRDALIVVDNCEHLLPHVTSVVTEILAECPRISLLATSRELLHLAGEQVYRLGPLAPGAAVQLFNDRAVAIAPGFNRSAREPVVRAICERLDGVPLAIELAAARVRALSVEDIHARLDERFRLLTGGDRSALPRQQTLEATIAWSYELLAPEEQSLLQRLTAFRGSFALAAATAVCANAACDEYHVLDLLTSLVDKSLLTVQLGTVTRYRLLETIRAFAAEKSLQAEAASIVRRQHALYFSNTAGLAYHQFDSRLPPGWLDQLAPDLDNYRAALEWLLLGDGDRAAGAQLAADCGPMFLRLGLLAEGLRWCDQARAVPCLPAATSARVEYVASMLYNNLFSTPQALACAQRAVDFYRETNDRRGLIRALSQLAQQYARAERFDEAREPAEEAIREARAFGEPRVLIGVLRRCAYALPSTDIVRARELFAEALAAAQSIDDREERAHVLMWWATREADGRSFERAIELSMQAFDVADSGTKLYLEANIAGYAIASGDFALADTHARSALALAAAAKHPLVTVLAVAYCAPGHAAHDAQEAALLLGYARARLAEMDWLGDSDDQLALDSARAVVERELGEVPLAPLLERGALLQRDEALALLAPTSARSQTAGLVAPSAGGDRIGTLLR